MTPFFTTAAFLLAFSTSPLFVAGFAPHPIASAPKNTALAAAAEKTTKDFTTDDSWVAFDFNNHDVEDIDHTEIQVGNSNWLVADFEVHEPSQQEVSQPEHDWFGTELRGFAAGRDSLKKVQISSATHVEAGENEWFSTSTPEAAITGNALSLNDLTSHKAVAVAPTKSQSISNGDITSDTYSALPDVLTHQHSVGVSRRFPIGANEWFSQSFRFSPKQVTPTKIASGGDWFTQSLNSGNQLKTPSVTAMGLTFGGSEWFTDAKASNDTPLITSTLSDGPSEWFSAALPVVPTTASVATSAFHSPSSSKSSDWFTNTAPENANIPEAPALETTKTREWFMDAIIQ